MGLFHVISRFDAYELCHQAVHQIGIELRLIGIPLGVSPNSTNFGSAT